MYDDRDGDAARLVHACTILGLSLSGAEREATVPLGGAGNSPDDRGVTVSDESGPRYVPNGDA